MLTGGELTGIGEGGQSAPGACPTCSYAGCSRGRGRSCTPGPSVRTPAELRDYVRSTVVSYHHQVGTCRMGGDEGAVVDPELRVYGVDGLRVADASVLPFITTGNTNAPTLMIGERASDLLLAAR